MPLFLERGNVLQKSLSDFFSYLFGQNWVIFSFLKQSLVITLELTMSVPESGEVLTFQRLSIREGFFLKNEGGEDEC